MSTTRQQKRAQFTDSQRVALLEDDADEHDAEHDRFAEELIKIKGILIGILISVTTASLLLAINLVVKT